MALFTGGGSGGAAGAGTPQLVFRYTVTSVDKASIDTGVDTPDAGTNVWTNGDVLEVFLYARTDEAVTESGLSFTVNNDTGNNYDRQNLSGISGVASAATSLGQAKWSSSCPGASATASNFGSVEIVIPNYMGTVGFKAGSMKEIHAEAVAGNSKSAIEGITWRSATAISRLAVTPGTAAKKLIVGSQLLIYKRLAS